MTSTLGQRVALITGASTGIGLATAKRLLNGGVFVILTARGSSLSRFDSVQFLTEPSHFWIRALDVTNPLERRELIDEIEKKLGRLDILINNAGVIYRTPLEYAYDFESKEQMQVNFHAPLELIKLTLPLMRKQGGGQIINISSAAGFFSVPTMGLYAASKHALEGASEALSRELRPWKICVSLIQPGFVSSDVYDRMRLGLAMERRKATSTAAAYTEQTRTITSLVQNAVRLTTVKPEDVAEAIWKVTQARHPPLRKAVTLDAKVFAFLKRFMPDRSFEALVAYCLKVISREAAHLPARA